MTRTLFTRTALASAAFAAFATFAEPSPGDITSLAIDALDAGPAVETGYLRQGSAMSPAGHVLGVNSQYLTFDGKPWFPVMGEFHYARFPARYWEEQLLKMKAAGVTTVSTYIFWQYHEETEGHFNWSGDRDLRRFLTLCRKVGLYVYLRPGPWAHAEVRFGGIPDWVVNAMGTRRNDPAYLAAVGKFYTEIAQQTRGLLWKDGGPIIGVQVENEYNLTGEDQGRDHIAALKKLLISAGFDVPYYSVTGWDNTIYPAHEVMPMFGGYPDEPWDSSTTKMPPKAVYSFQFNSRVSKGLGAETEAAGSGDAEADMPHTPFLSAEFGGGVPTMYRRRPIIEPDDVAAMLPVQIGSGVNLYGYYMFQGGQNQPGAPSREENTAIGGYNDLPQLGYDFGAPLGEYGQSHPVLAKLRPWHAFLQSWGVDLAPMHPHKPAVLSTGPSDLATPRFSVRSSGDQGFLFVSNHVRQYAMAPQKTVQFAVTLPHETLIFPHSPVTIPTDAYFAWPINLPIGNTRLRWATAQPLTRLQDRNGAVVVLRAIRDIPVALSFDAQTTDSVAGPDGAIALSETDGGLLLENILPGNGTVLTVHAKDGSFSRILILTADAAEKSWVVDFAGQRRIVETDSQLFGSNDWLEQRSIGNADIRFAIFPALPQMPSADQPLVRGTPDGVFDVYESQQPVVPLSASATLERAPGKAAPITIGGPAKAAQEPTPEAFGVAGRWRLHLSDVTLKGLSDAYLTIRYQGDVARLFTGYRMIDDEFYNGVPWVIGLKRYPESVRNNLTLSILPLRQDAPIYLEDAMRPTVSPDGQVAAIAAVSLVPEYRLRIQSPTTGSHRAEGVAKP